METIGERIKRLRKAAGLTQDQLGDRVGVTGQIISKYERGEFGPRRGTATELARVLGTSVEQLDSGSETAAEGPRVVEEFLETEEGKRATPEQAGKLRTLRFGGVEPTVAMVRAIWLEMVATEAGKAIERPVIKVQPRPGRRKIGGKP